MNSTILGQNAKLRSWLTVTKVVFELIKRKEVDIIETGLTVTKVVFE